MSPREAIAVQRDALIPKFLRHLRRTQPGATAEDAARLWARRYGKRWRQKHGRDAK